VVKDGETIQKRVDRDMETLRQISPIAYALERLFHLGGLLSPERLFGPTRMQINTGYPDLSDRRLAARVRGRRIETYLGAWMAIEACLVGFGTLAHSPYVTYPFLALAVLRIADIIQITGNHSLFDRLKFSWRHYHTESTVRTILLSLINYVELVICFGYIYCVLGRGRLLPLEESPFDGYYFSGVTQLTIGYGDINPHGAVKYLALFQGFIGFLFTILILGRFISLLPEVREEAEP
jgi:hypothetical protein